MIPRLVSEEDSIEQLCEPDHTLGFTIHFLKEKPVTPVTIGCSIKKANELADLSFVDKNSKSKTSRKTKDSSEWDVDIKEGNYDFLAEFPAEEYQGNSESRYIRPPYRRVTIPVRK